MFYSNHNCVCMFLSSLLWKAAKTVSFLFNVPFNRDKKVMQEFLMYAISCKYHHYIKHPLILNVLPKDLKSISKYVFGQKTKQPIKVSKTKKLFGSCKESHSIKVCLLFSHAMKVLPQFIVFPLWIVNWVG